MRNAERNAEQPKLPHIMSLSKIELGTLSEALGVTPRAIRKWIANGRIASRHVDVTTGRGGKRYMVDPHGLPEPHRSTYLLQSIEDGSAEVDRAALDEARYQSAQSYQRDHADLWLGLLDAFGHLGGQELRHALEVYAEEHEDVSCSYSTFMRKKKAYKQDGIEGLLPGWGNRAGDSKIKNEDFELFKSLYLTEEKRSVRACWEHVAGAAVKRGDDLSSYPVAKTFVTRLQRDVSESAIYLAREGREAWLKKFAYHADRDPDSVQPGQVWFSDHRQLDTLVTDPDSGEMFRPWLTAWMDFRSLRFMGMFVHKEAPNSDHIFQSFRWAAEKNGLPRHIYIDNGKDYRCKDFAGQPMRHTLDVEEGGPQPAAIKRLGIDVTFALPYNAQAKTIERRFQELIRLMEKFQPGYTAGTPSERPEHVCKANATAFLQAPKHKELFDRYVSLLNARPGGGKYLDGRSPDEIWADRAEERRVRSDALRLFCMRTSHTRQIGRRGWYDRDLDRTYWAEWMVSEKGRTCFLRRDLADFSTAYVYDAEDGTFVGEAHLLAQEDAFDGHDARDVMRQRRRELKTIREEATATVDAPTGEDALELLEAYTEALNKERRQADDYTEPTPPNIYRLDNTDVDEDLGQIEQQRRTGTDDLEYVPPPEDPAPEDDIKLWDDE